MKMLSKARIVSLLSISVFLTISYFKSARSNLMDYSETSTVSIATNNSLRRKQVLKVTERCGDVNNMKRHNEIWQVLEYTVNNTASPARQIYAHKLYYDSRFNKTSVKGFISSLGYLDGNFTLHGKFWTVDQKIPSPSTLCTLKLAGVSVWKVAGKAYIPYLITCPLPENVNISLVEAVSLTCGSLCIKVLTKTCLEVIIPKKPKVPAERTKTIGLCLKGMYYDFQNDTVTQFIQWMEALSLFGISHVTMYNTTIRETSRFAKPVFDYYRQKGKLTIINFPSIATDYNEKSPYEKKSSAELLQPHSTGDCFYSNLYNYWYILHIDLDEIPVPRGEMNTYQQLLAVYLSKHPTASQAFSLSMKSAFNYLYFQPSHPEIPEYMSLLRHAHRMPVDTPTGNNAGYMKSFVNPRKCDIVWAHRCLWGPYEVVSENEVFINHYRDSCRLGKKCDSEWERHVTDVHLLTNFGTIIQTNSEKVLKKIGFMI